MTLSEALAALNDHLGERVEVAVTSGAALPMMHAEGVLSHWSEQTDGTLRAFPLIADWEDARAGVYRVGAPESAALAGVYRVGDASIFLLEGWAKAIAQEGSDDRGGIAFEIAPGVSLTVGWGRE